MTPFAQPEILVSDLSPLALELLVWGIKDPRELAWLDAPPAAAWESALQLLKVLGALERSGPVTALGRAMARLPIHPRLSRLMLKAQELGCLSLGADLAALLTERDIFRHGAADRSLAGPDVSERVDALQRRRAGTNAGGAADPSALKAVERTSKQLLRLMPGAREDSARCIAEPELISRLLLSAYPDRICKRREEGGGRFVHVQGRGVRLSLDSHLGSSPYIVAVFVDAGEKSEGIVHIAAPVSEELIRSVCGARIEIVRRAEWDKKGNRIASSVEERLGALLLSSRPFTPTDEEAGPILCDVIRSSPGMLTFSNEARQFQGRVRFVKKSFPEEAWPDFTDERLASHPEEWLLPWLGNIRSAQSLAGLSLLPALRARLSRDQQRLLDERAPVSLLVPSGSRVALDYTTGGQPVLAVKLQEMFGLADTPLVADGRIRVLLHLLSPAHRPVQITQDLKGFWNSAYPQVKKEMKGRYPKHPWPDDPGNAVPTRRTKPRKG
jgi:ATP-dependent helicase HrpB